MSSTGETWDELCCERRRGLSRNWNGDDGWWEEEISEDVDDVLRQPAQLICHKFKYFRENTENLLEQFSYTWNRNGGMEASSVQCGRIFSRNIEWARQVFTNSS